jgi:hypothetical protein
MGMGLAGALGDRIRRVAMRLGRDLPIAAVMIGSALVLIQILVAVLEAAR